MVVRYSYSDVGQYERRARRERQSYKAEVKKDGKEGVLQEVSTFPAWWKYALATTRNRAIIQGNTNTQEKCQIKGSVWEHIRIIYHTPAPPLV